MSRDVTGPTASYPDQRTGLSSLASLKDRAAGALVGLAVGDALGATLDFLDRDERPHYAEMTGGGIHRLPPGAWTGDTSLALCIADSLFLHQQLVPDDIMRRFVRWWLDGENSSVGYCFNAGQTTIAALHRFLRTRDAFAGIRDEEKSSDGCIARLAPVAIFRNGHSDAARHEACTQGSLTHDTPLCVEACELLATMLVEAFDGASKIEVLRPRLWRGHAQASLLAGGSWKMKTRGAIRSSGFVLDTLEAALWAIEDAGSFEEAVVRAVNLAGKAASVGAVAGQLAGAIWGLSAIPERWLAPLFEREAIERRAYALLDAGAANRAFERHGCARAARSRKARISAQPWLPLHPAGPGQRG